MVPAAERDGAVAEARAYVAGQRVRHRVLLGVLICVALLNAGLVALIVAAIAGSAKAGLVVVGIVAVLVALTFVAASVRLSGAVAGMRGERDPVERQRLEESVGRLAAQLGVDVPRVCVIDDDASNAFVVGHGRGATVVFTSGLVELCGDDEELLEAVAAHELAATAARGTTLTWLSYALLGWSLSLAVPAREIAGLLRKLSRRFRKGDPEVPRYEGESQADYMVDSLILLMITRAIGVVLWLASGCVLVLCGVPWLIARVTRAEIVGRRVVAADAVAVQLTGDKPALAEILGELGGAPTTPDRGGRLVEELCFVGPPPPPETEKENWTDWFPPYPDIKTRLAELAAFERGCLPDRVPVAGLLVAGVLLLALLGGLGTLAVRLPYDRASGPSQAAGAVPGAVPPPVDSGTPTSPVPLGPASEPGSKGASEPGTSPSRKSTVTSSASASPSPSTTSAPAAAPPGDKPPDDNAPPRDNPGNTEVNTLTEAHWNDFCSRQFGVAARFGPDAYSVGCVGIDHAFNAVTDVCAVEFPGASPNVDRLGDFHDPLSWGCIAHAGLLGAFQLSETELERQTGRDVVYHADVSPSAYGYTYADGSPIALGELCAKTYATSAVDRLLDVYNAHSSVECYRSAV
ncbi:MULTISPECIES: M48 family metalloprotease [unclassified Streptomyces]|uniref:M48 family metalloprotease n=1 Tax=unclassified Streptomyces TaxID=2593676 RepID=UPI002E80A078|nr:M48 family metalloprotease [Streptomyces sp. NBC_00589]WTI40142.1 M48 family metalloprotease [Streptomyces sp. NBC_00775]WUB26177.1 M48 family metalloprotease [Streptomyces sp. NBC_00589]